MSNLVLLIAGWNLLIFLGCAIFLGVKYKERKGEKIQEKKMLEKYKNY